MDAHAHWCETHRHYLAPYLRFRFQVPSPGTSSSVTLQGWRPLSASQARQRSTGDDPCRPRKRGSAPRVATLPRRVTTTSSMCTRTSSATVSAPVSCARISNRNISHWRYAARLAFPPYILDHSSRRIWDHAFCSPRRCAFGCSAFCGRSILLGRTATPQMHSARPSNRREGHSLRLVPRNRGRSNAGDAGASFDHRREDAHRKRLGRGRRQNSRPAGPGQ
jgi:hypothetical protein